MVFDQTIASTATKSCGAGTSKVITLYQEILCKRLWTRTLITVKLGFKSTDLFQTCTVK